MGVDYASYGTPRLELGAALHEYEVSQNTFIGTKLFGVTPVTKKAANYPVVTRESLLARADVKRAPRSAYNRTGFQTEDKAYACGEFGLEGQLDASERELYANDFDAEMETSKDILVKLLREQEMRVAALAFSETTFDASTVFFHTGTVWSNVASTIVADIQAAALKVFQNCGMPANTLTISRTVLNYLLSNTDIKARIQYAQVAGWDQIKAALASLIGIPQILVGDGVYNTKPEGATAATIGNIWTTDYALVSIAPQAGSVIQPALGRTFLWTSDSPENVMVESYDEPQTRSTVFRVRQNVQEAVIDKFFGCLIDVAHTS